MKLENRRWLILIAGCLINLCIGALYTWSVFLGPLVQRLNDVSGLAGTASALTTADMSLVITVYNVFVIISTLLGGAINDRFGPRIIAVCAAVSFGLGYWLTGLSQSLVTVVIGYGVFNGFGAASVYSAVLGCTIKYFPDRRGMASGIIVACSGLSSVILSPIANSLISNYSVNKAFCILGTAFFAVMLISALVLKKCPDGWTPSGWTPPGDAVSAEGKNWREMLRDGHFYIMLLILLLASFAGLSVNSHASAIAQTAIGATPAAAALMVSLMALFNTFGRFIGGMLSDRIGRGNTITLGIMCDVLGLAALILSLSTGSTLFVVGICLLGLGFGSVLGTYPSYCADHFGARHSSVNYGIMFSGYSLAGMIAPLTTGYVYQRSGAYLISFIIAIALAAVGLITALLFNRREKHEHLSV